MNSHESTKKRTNKGNLLLIGPEGALKNPSIYLGSRRQEQAPLLYLMSSLERQGYKTYLLKSDISEKEICKIIEKRRPIAVGYTAYTYTLLETFEVAKIVKQKSKNLGYKIYNIFGGPHVSAMPRETAAKDEVDFVIPGEGEITLGELMDAITQKKNFKEVAGIFMKENGKIIQTAPRQRIKNLDRIPRPKRYKNLLSTPGLYQICYPPPSMQTGVAGILYARGCPFACSFCCSRNIWGNQIYWRSPKKVIGEMEYLFKKYKVNIFIFADLTFNANKQKVLEFCQEFKKRNLPVYWMVMARTDLFDEETLKAMAEAKCVKFCLGIESPDENIASFVKDGYVKKSNLIKKNLETANNLGIFLKAFLIIGFPNQTKKEIEAYPTLLQSMPIDELRITIATPFPGTDLWNECRKNNLISEEPSWSDFSTEKLVFKHPSISPEQMVIYQKSILINYYSSEHYHGHVMNKIKMFPHFNKSYLEYFNMLLRDRSQFGEAANKIQKIVDDINKYKR